MIIFGIAEWWRETEIKVIPRPTINSTAGSKITPEIRPATST
jgi:hypothetical protein